MTERAAPPIEVRGLVKRYGTLEAVAGVDLTVNAGDVYGYLGPNGAGKTTSLRMMLGLITPTAGTVRLFGRDPISSVSALQGVAGFVEAPMFYSYLSGRRNLELLAAYDGGDARTRIDAALDIVELTGRQRDRVGGYSHGMRQRLGIAASLLRDPRLLLLDEPATGLDPGGLRDMRRLVRRLADEGMTVLLSSHLLGEVEEVCNRVAIVRRGRVVYEGEIAALTRAGAVLRLRTSDDALALAVCEAQPGVTGARRVGDHLELIAEEPAVGALSQALVEAGALIHELAPQSATLVVLLFGAIWLFPLIAALVAGDIVASEDQGGTLKTILTRSLERWQVFCGKGLIALSYACVATFLCGTVGVLAGSLQSGFNPLQSLSGTIVSAPRALLLVYVSLAVYLIPIAAVVCIGLMLSTVTRNSAAAVVGTLMLSIVFQLIGILPGLSALQPYLLSTQFNAWQGLLRTPVDWEPIVRAAWVCAIYAGLSLGAAFVVFVRRDVNG